MKRGLKLLSIVLIALVLIVVSYVAYVFDAYYRVEDHQTLKISELKEQNRLANGVPLRLLSYNIGFGAYSNDYSFFMDGGKESRARSPEAVYENIGGAVAAIQMEEPDLVLLQEVDEDGTRSYHIDQHALVKDALPEFSSVYAQDYDSPYLMWPLTKPHGANKAGILTLSRFSIDDAERRSLPVEKGVMKLVDLDRCYSVSKIPVTNGKTLALYNLHLSAYTSDGKIAEEQLKMLLSDMQEEVNQGNYAVAGGDFNKDLLGNSGDLFGISGEENHWAQAIPPELIPQEFDLVAPYDPQEKVASCRNADRPYGPDDFRVTVDGFLISENVEKISAHVVETEFHWSDHNPVVLDFILR